MECNLYAVRVFIEHWDESVEFYENVLELECVFKDKDMGWAQYKVGASHLGLERVADDSKDALLVGRFVGVSLMVDDVDQTYRELLEKGVSFSEPPEKQPWGGVLAHFSDPDNNVLTLLGQPS
ncbi:MAG: VOC family protein [Pseudomonadales bacterium]|jgi:predicted enzyme related to lactoylglutathione lyase|nr:VOC family protein [Pseudomonadales bacterium]MDP7357816.1 VOC family protein [Pseudomonadales bacterium]MDP7596797.1 VOC family protein [Pseudomonadales bacterium]HJN52025.1 VOC family protein [Pseudomonadales bacterium]|tara:strand:- start:13 stop:381 length:369 start_codon:yes stop_codon:yes gene_type:complete